MALSLTYQSEAQFADRFWSRLRDAYRSGDKFAFSRLIWWLYGKVQSGDLTSNQVRLSFNAAYGRSLNSTQWNSFVSGTLAPIRDRYQAILDQADL